MTFLVVGSFVLLLSDNVCRVSVRAGDDGKDAGIHQPDGLGRSVDADGSFPPLSVLIVLMFLPSCPITLMS